MAEPGGRQTGDIMNKQATDDAPKRTQRMKKTAI
jgi:hypothetical protein